MLKLYPYQARWFKDPSRRKFAVKSRRIGYSFGDGFENVFACLSRPKHTCIVLSRGERQAKQYIEEAVAPHVRALDVIAEFTNSEIPESSITAHNVYFSNGSRIIGLPANPATARSYEGDVTLDEFAFHQNARTIYESVAPSVTRGYRLKIISTPNGQQGVYYDLAVDVGLIDGKVKNKNWSVHRTTLLEAIAQGCLDRNGKPLDAEEIRASCLDNEMWLQEFCAEFLTLAAQWIPPELFQSCVDAEASCELGDYSNYSRKFFAGWDIARNKDLSVIWILESLGDVTWTRGVLEFRNMATPDQLREARSLLRDVVYKMVIDKSGMGLAIYEALAEEFYGRVEGVQFTLQAKEALAVHAKMRMLDRNCRIPDTDTIRNSFRSVKKTVTATGQARFDAEHDAEYGHADHWWAFALAENAAALPVHGLFEVWKEEAEALHGSTKRPEEMAPDELANMQAVAQMRAAASDDTVVARVFGEQVGMPKQQERVQKVVTVKQTPACPKCGSKALSRYAAQGISGDLIEECACGWTNRIPRG